MLANYVAVSELPSSAPLMLALAALETYESARELLQRACDSHPTNFKVWSAVAELEERNGNAEKVLDTLSQGANSRVLFVQRTSAHVSMCGIPYTHVPQRH